MSGSVCWLWVIRPEYYLDSGGGDSPELEPDAGFVADGWWTCDRQTRAGDLVLLYRANVRKDISHFLVARSDAQQLDEPGSDFHGEWTCQYEVLARFDRPLLFSELVADPLMRDWLPVKIRMHRRAFAVPAIVWLRLGELLDADFSGLAEQALDGLNRIRRERELERRLLTQPQLLSKAGLRRLRLLQSQRRLPTGRVADLVYQQGRGVLRRMVVVELKKIKAGPSAVDQVLGYRATLDRRRRWWQRRTHAVLISDPASASATQLAAEHGVQLISLSQLGMAVTTEHRDKGA